jgi:hypothetical protein
VPELQIVRGRKSEPHSCLVRRRVKGTYGVRAGQPHLCIIFQAGPLLAAFQMLHFYIDFYTVQRAPPPANALSSATASSLPSLPPAPPSSSLLLPPAPPSSPPSSSLPHIPPAPPSKSRRRRHAQQSSFFGNGIAATSHETLLEEQGRGQAFSPPQRPAVTAGCSRRLCVARRSLSRRHVAPRRAPRTRERVDWPRD